MSADELGEAKWLDVGALSAIDFRVPDERVVFASGARGSSQYSDSYAARSIIGPPKIFPEGGDEYGTWLADNSDHDPWLEVHFPPTRAVALLVFETCGPGAVFEVIDAARDRTLYRGEARRFSDTRKARLFHVTLDGSEELSKVKLRVKPRAFGGDEWKEIDAVALLTEPLESVLRAPPRFVAGREKRYRPEEAAHFPLRKPDSRVLWAREARASSQYSGSYSAGKATGRPTVYPKSGDQYETWCPSGDGHNEWLELDFPDHDVAKALAVFETNVAGSVVRVTAPDDTVLWQGLVDREPEDEARLLYIPFEDDYPKKRLRLWLSGELRGYRQIDAVALLTVPLDELHGPPPPPPKKYPPGTPKGGWTRLEGTLSGEVVHASLHGPRSSAHANHGSATLRLADGDEVALAFERTTVYGARLERHRGELDELRARAPRLLAAFAGAEESGAHTLEGSRLDDGATVIVLGEVTGSHADGGFRDSARSIPTAMRASAVVRADAPNVDALLEGHAPARFERKRPASKPAAVRHPLTGYAIGCAITAAVIAGAGVVAAAPWVLLAACLPAIFTFDFAARIWAVPAFTAHASSGLSDRKVLVKTPWAVMTMNGFFLVMAAFSAVFASLMATGFRNEADAATMGLGAVVFGFGALRAIPFWRVQAGPMRRALRALTAGSATRFSGTLGPGTFARKETCQGQSQHLGTYQTTDDQGNVSTRDEYRSWYERHVTVSGPGEVSVVLPDGTIAHAPATRTETTDATLYPIPTQLAGETLHLRGHHEEGDPATLIGPSHVEGHAHAVETPRLLVLGPMSALRNRVLAVLLSSTALFAIMVLGAVMTVVASRG